MSETMGRLLAAGQRAEVFEWGSRVVKLCRSTGSKQETFREAAIHAAVEGLGLPVPTVWSVQQIGGRWGIVFDRVDGISFAEQMRADVADVPQYLQILARLHRRIHTHRANQFNSLKVWLATNIARTILLDELRKQVLHSGLAEMPDGDRLCHGDFHPMNVLGKASQPIVIDWPNASRGDPAGDVCRSYLLLKLHAKEVAGAYLDAYCGVSCFRARQSSTGCPTSQRPDCRKTSPASEIAYWNLSGHCNQDGRRSAVVWRAARCGYPPLVRVPLGHRLLHRDRAAHRIDDARKFHQHAVAGGLNDPAVMRLDRRLEQLGPYRLKGSESHPRRPRSGASTPPHRRRGSRRDGGSRSCRFAGC